MAQCPQGPSHHFCPPSCAPGHTTDLFPQPWASWGLQRLVDRCVASLSGMGQVGAGESGCLRLFNGVACDCLLWSSSQLWSRHLPGGGLCHGLPRTWPQHPAGLYPAHLRSAGEAAVPSCGSWALSSLNPHPPWGLSTQSHPPWWVCATTLHHILVPGRRGCPGALRSSLPSAVVTCGCLHLHEK